jgi:hypothetical protein
MQEDKGHNYALIVSRFLWPGLNRNRSRKAAARPYISLSRRAVILTLSGTKGKDLLFFSHEQE